MRRMFRRERRKTFAPNIPPILQEANLAFEKGEYGRAAERYEKIAIVADGRGGSRAPLFYLQAGRARIYAGQTTLGMPSLKHGLKLLAQRGPSQRLYQAGMQIISELNGRGLKDEAIDIEIMLNKFLPQSPSPEPLTILPILPTHCPSCGAPLHPVEVDWLNNVTAECGYCGSPVSD